MVKVYYMDGYHGGIRGHMDLGSWRDILDRLREQPDWKLSIDVEPVSWDYLRERDPAAYEEMRQYIIDGNRIEIVAGSYAQPYGWITDGESNIRHLTRGLEILRNHFPEVKIETYAVQEPCWTSALPQILRQLGYKQASLKNASTAWGGYTEGYSAETVDWAGPDGTSIPTIPRYHCEDLVNVYATEARDATPDWAELCEKEGIPHPTGMYFQDLGWHANPGVSGEHIEFSLIRDYFKKIMSGEENPRPVWQPGQEIFRGALPWGDKTLVEMARQVRRGEIGIQLAERLHGFATLKSQILASDTIAADNLAEAWGHLLMTQHHDGWICAAAGFGEKNWAWKTSAQIYAMEFLTDKLNRQSLDAIKEVDKTKFDISDEWITVFNPLAKTEKRIIRMPMTAKTGTRSFEIYDGDKRIPCQMIVKRNHPDGTINAGELVFAAELSGFGTKSFRIIESTEESTDIKRVQAFNLDGKVVLENDCARVVIDLDHGGTIVSYVDKICHRELVPDGAYFNEFRGYFIREDRFCSSTENPAKAKIGESGPLEASVTIQGKIADSGYRMIYTLCADSPKIDVQLTFHFGENTHIGEPYIMKNDGEHDPHRTYHDGRYRLNAYFPTTFAQKFVYKDCAYDVCKSNQRDTHFKTWNKIKHNNFLHWVDTTDGENGLAVLADHTTAYIHGEDCSFGLALAWGYDGGFWWGRRTLRGGHSLRYQIFPHKGDWQKDKIWHISDDFLHCPKARRVLIKPDKCTDTAFEIHTEGVELGAFYTENGAHILRIFNASAENTAKISLNPAYFTKMTEVSPDGREDVQEIVLINSTAELPIPAFGIRTYRLEK